MEQHGKPHHLIDRNLSHRRGFLSADTLLNLFGFETSTIKPAVYLLQVQREREGKKI